MKIIEDNYRSFKAQCQKCRSILRIDIGEVQGGKETYWFHCLACDKNSDLAQIPQNIQDDLERFGASAFPRIGAGLR